MHEERKTMSDLYYGWKKSNTESITLFSIKDQSKDTRLTTQTHGYHKPYAADWGEAKMKAKAKIIDTQWED